MKRPVLQNKGVTVLGMAFRAQKFFGTFEKRALGRMCKQVSPDQRKTSSVQIFNQTFPAQATAELS